MGGTINPLKDFTSEDNISQQYPLKVVMEGFKVLLKVLFKCQLVFSPAFQPSRKIISLYTVETLRTVTVQWINQ